MRIDGHSLHGGSASGEVAKLNDTISFWGGIDMSGTIIDQAHPQAGTSIAGKIVALAGSRGSCATPAALCEMLRRGTGPAAILVTEPDINVVVGAMVAAELYAVDCPVVLIEPARFDNLIAGETVEVGANRARIP
ncbi:aconitase X swivel domain-containing protein [Candidatus Poriferisodalis sp.]|uniref:aconitase X swivel domain-containing protein n=1 Tax=Candidatus Poriferisodalis sp. TaxID=3101277 RepID=UPI003B52D689